MNSFDGAMTILGIIVGSFAYGSLDPKMIIGAGLGAGLAMTVSGFSGAYMTERAERRRGLMKLEQAMLKQLNNSIHGKAMRMAAIWTAFVYGLSPAIAAIICLIPFFLANLHYIEIFSAFYASIGIVMGMLFILGIFLGKISDENLLLSGLRTLMFGLVTALIVILASGG